jgi:hypothetical protein
MTLDRGPCGSPTCPACNPHYKWDGQNRLATFLRSRRIKVVSVLACSRQKWHKSIRKSLQRDYNLQTTDYVLLRFRENILVISTVPVGVEEVPLAEGYDQAKAFIRTMNPGPKETYACQIRIPEPAEEEEAEEPSEWKLEGTEQMAASEQDTVLPHEFNVNTKTLKNPPGGCVYGIIYGTGLMHPSKLQAIDERVGFKPKKLSQAEREAAQKMPLPLYRGRGCGRSLAETRALMAAEEVA